MEVCDGTRAGFTAGRPPQAVPRTPFCLRGKATGGTRRIKITGFDQGRRTLPHRHIAVALGTGGDRRDLADFAKFGPEIRIGREPVIDQHPPPGARAARTAMRTHGGQARFQAERAEMVLAGTI